MKVLILGATGILGRTLFYFLLNKKNVDLKCISRSKKDKSHIYLSNFLNFEILKKSILNIKPTHIVNCLGVTKFNKNYKLQKKTIFLNAKLPIYLSKLCLKNKIKMIHISTDCVFSGIKGNYKETSKKDATDLYGITKSKGEVKNKYCSTIRTSFIGPETKTKKSLLNWFLSEKKKVKGYDKAFFSGITSLELSKIIYKYFILEDRYFNKILNIGGNKISKFLLLSKINTIFKKKIIIEKSSHFKIDRSLNSLKFQRSSGYKIQNWNKMLAELKFFMKKNFYKF